MQNGKESYADSDLLDHLGPAQFSPYPLALYGLGVFLYSYGCYALGSDDLVNGVVFTIVGLPMSALALFPLWSLCAADALHEERMGPLPSEAEDTQFAGIFATVFGAILVAIGLGLDGVAMYYWNDGQPNAIVGFCAALFFLLLGCASIIRGARWSGQTRFKRKTFPQPTERANFDL